MILRLFRAPAALAGALLFAPGTVQFADSVVLVPDQEAAGFHFSAMQLNYAVPALSCVMTECRE